MIRNNPKEFQNLIQHFPMLTGNYYRGLPVSSLKSLNYWCHLNCFRSGAKDNCNFTHYNTLRSDFSDSGLIMPIRPAPYKQIAATIGKTINWFQLCNLTKIKASADAVRVSI